MAALDAKVMVTDFGVARSAFASGSMMFGRTKPVRFIHLISSAAKAKHSTCLVVN
jgi:hypothetical protein